MLADDIVVKMHLVSLVRGSVACARGANKFNGDEQTLDMVVSSDQKLHRVKFHHLKFQ